MSMPRLIQSFKAGTTNEAIEVHLASFGSDGEWR
jgi:hypothetical protein